MTLVTKREPYHGRFHILVSKALCIANNVGSGVEGGGGLAGGMAP